MKIDRKIYVNYTKEELLSLPMRDCLTQNKNGIYDSILILPNNSKHDSGWRCMSIIGIKDMKPIEIISSGCDDLNFWNDMGIYNVRCDCCWKSRAMHYWGNDLCFEIGFPTSSIDIKVHKKVKNE